jgi:hypothetical protein
MPYIKVSHGSDTNYIFNGLFPEGQISDDDEKLSRDFAVAFIDFANFGHPGTFNGGSWPEAFSQDHSELLESTPHSFNLQVVGGPYGTGPALLSSEKLPAGETRLQDPEFEEGLTDDRQFMPGISVGVMSSPLVRLRKTVLDREQLLRRCEFLNSISEQLGV